MSKRRKWNDDPVCMMCGHSTEENAVDPLGLPEARCHGHTDEEVADLVVKLRHRLAKLGMWVTTEAFPALRLAQTGWKEAQDRAAQANEQAGAFELGDLVSPDGNFIEPGQAEEDNDE